jgi:vacuolar protein sorting-associated protein IST1
MEFKDATAAAQAAAESAERASMAARAAAELSSQDRITRQHLAESQKAFSFASRDVGPQNYTGSKLQGEDVDKDQMSNVYQRHPGLHHEEREGNEQDDLAGLTKRFYNLKSPNKPSQSASSKSSNSFVADSPLIDDLPMPDRLSQKRSSELGESSVKLESRESEVSFVSKLEDRMTSENVSHFEEARIRKQSSSVSSHSHSQTFSDDYNVFSNTNQQRMGDETDQEQRDAKGANSYDNAMVFDDFSSDKEIKFDVEDEHNDQEYDLDFSSEGRKSSSHLLANTDAWGRTENMDEFRGKSSSQTPLTSAFFSQDFTDDPVPSKPHDLLPMTFDDSDSLSSETEVDLDTYEVVGGSSTGIFAHTKSVSTRNSDPIHNGSPHSIRFSLADEENLGSNRKTHLQTASLDSDVQVFSKKNQGTGFDVEMDNKFAYGKLDTSQSSPIPLKSCTSSNDLKDNLQTSGHPVVKNVQNYELPITTKNADPIEESNLETGTELNLGILTGGFRNKGYRHPPYHRNLSNNSSSSEQVIENIHSRTGRTSSPVKVDIGSGARNQETNSQRLHPKVDVKASSRTPATYYDDDSDEEVPQQHFSKSPKSYGRKSVIEGNDRSSTKISDNRDSEFSKPNSSSKTHLSTRFSRRTKASPFEKDYSSKPSVLSKSPVSADSFVERTPSSSSSYTADTQSIPQSRSSGYQGSSEQCRSTEEAASKRIQQSKRFSYEESSPRSSDAISSQQKPPSQSKGSDYWASSRQSPSSAEQAASKQISESKRTLREETLKSSAREQPCSSPPKPVAADSAQSSKTSSTHGEMPSRENSINKPSHVHPKLPDYDTFAAHLLSLRQNHQ